MCIEAPGKLDKLQIAGPRLAPPPPRDSDSANLKWGPRICILLRLPGESDAMVLKPSQERALMEPSAKLKLALSFPVIDRTTLYCHPGLVLLEVGKTKKEGTWRREKEGCRMLGSSEAEAETGIAQ